MAHMATPRTAEVLAHSRYGRAADLWSYGCVVIAARLRVSGGMGPFERFKGPIYTHMYMETGRDVALCI